MVLNTAMDPDTVETELARLNSETRTLSEELVQCQADKDFVWSLWKRLQVANPDITQAISMVMQREKEKNEIKDRKVLEILQCKDDKIDEMQTALTKQSTELSEMLNKKVDLQGEKNILENENERLKDKLSMIELQLKGLENREQNMDDLFRKSVEGAETDKQELLRKVRDMTQELEIVKAEKSDNLAQRINLENKVRSYERDVTEKVARFEGLIREHEEAKRLLQKYEGQMRQHTAELEFKNKELEAVRKELSDLWNSHNQLTEHSGQQADLIRQLQSLQQDTQRMLQTQEDAYSMESSSVQQMYVDVSTKYELLKKAESELRQDVLDLKKILHDKDDVIVQLQNRLDTSSSSRRHPRRYDLEGSFITAERETDGLAEDIEYKINNMKREINILRERLEEKDRVIESLNKSIEFDVSHLNRERTHSTPSRDVRSIAVSPIRSSFGTSAKRNRSLSPSNGSRDLHRQLRNTERKLIDVENILKIKNRELNELKKAHTRRLDRLKTVQSNYRLVKEQLKIHEDDHGSKKKKKLKRADPRDLQKEDSDGVWNELAYFKSEHRNTAVENMALQEEVDSLRVQSSHDAATIHELKVALEQEREEYEYTLKRREIESLARHDYEAEIRELKSEINTTNISHEKLSRDLREVVLEREKLYEERKVLKAEIFDLKQAEAHHRITTTDLKRVISRLERELDEKNLPRPSPLHVSSKSSSAKSKKFPAKPIYANRKSKAAIAKQYQKALNKSIERMKSMFEDFNDEDWEELTETEETEDTECTSDSLGRDIVNISNSKLRQEMTSDTTSSSSHRKPSKSKKSLVRTRSDPLRRRPLSSGTNTDVTSSNSASSLARRVVLRETATSPIGFLQESWSSPRKPSKASKLSAASPSSRQLQSMKQRLYYLQQQLNALRESRSAALKSVTELKESSSQLQADLNLSTQRLKLTKSTNQKLSSDLDRLQKEKSDIELQLALKDESTTTVASTDNKQRDSELKSLESRLKSSNTEVTRQSSNIKSLKSDNESLQEQIKALQDKINRLERDNSQKRTLLEDQRMRLKIAQEKEKSEANNSTELDTKIKLLTDSNEKQRIQIESYKKRLNVVVKEKHECEEKMRKITSDLAKKTKQLSECQTKITDLEAVICELDQTAKQQLHGLASQSEAAIETAQQRLSLLNFSLQQYQHFIKSFALELVSRVQRTRNMFRDVQAKKFQTQKSDPHLEKAKTVAKDILNLSQSDLDDILSADGERLDAETENEKKKDKKWLKKCDKVLGGKEPFAMPLVELFLSKLEERNEILSRLQNL